MSADIRSNDLTAGDADTTQTERYNAPAPESTGSIASPSELVDRHIALAKAHLAAERISDKKLISLAIASTGLSVRKFAAKIVIRNPRTVWRWLAGENALPVVVREKCEDLIVASEVS